MRVIATFTLLCCLLPSALAEEKSSARDIIQRAVDHYRGLTSYSEMTMVINRPEWQRSMTIKAWTAGDKQTLVRVLEPRKDAGNGTLSLDSNMWTYTPKINRVIKVPSSMMGQNWMGSDISKNADIIDQYDHTLLEQREQDGRTVYVIESVPHEEAAVVWGKEIIMVRDDWVMLEQQYWDQDGVLVKTLEAKDIKTMSGRAVATVVRMSKRNTPEQWTELRTAEIEFDIELSANLFTLSNLRNPRN